MPYTDAAPPDESDASPVVTDDAEAGAAAAAELEEEDDAEAAEAEAAADRLADEAGNTDDSVDVDR